MQEVCLYTIDEVNKRLGQPTLHPQVAVLDAAALPESGRLCFSGNFYSVCFRHTSCGDPRYGRRCADFQYATLAFTAPGGIVTMERADAVAGGASGILFRPELFSMKSLVFKKNDYTFFGYRPEESLHLSLQEMRAVQDGMAQIRSELSHDIDRFSLRLAAVGLELLLDRCLRCYERQFIVRTDQNRRHLSAIDTALRAFLAGAGMKSAELGAACARQAVPQVSEAYIDDLVRVETGKTLTDYVRLKMVENVRERLLRGSLTADGMAGEFGRQETRALTLLHRRLYCELPGKLEQALCRKTN